jgi:uncharacterized membrane protein YdjX (TVP38/TMEM64 family)
VRPEDVPEAPGARPPRSVPWRGIIAALTLLAATWALHDVVAAGGGPRELVARHGGWAPALSVPLLSLTAWALLPSEFVAVAQGALYGFALGTAANWSGWMATALLQYGLVRWGFLKASPEALLARAPRFIRRFPVSHPVFLIVGRQLPFGSPLVNTLAPALGVPLWRHLWCSGLAILPLSALCAAAGAGLIRW